MPQLLREVPPIYPASRFAQGVEDTVVVHALVCRSGKVLDAFAPPTYRGNTFELIEGDPKLVDAAVAAVKQYEFSRGEAAGWYSLKVIFRR